ncbi:MAG TPA: hypothetical protein PLC79_03365 [Phycisphaerae bacterium]|nr:hypothetical protein [Phycisphaerae bacterium]
MATTPQFCGFDCPYAGFPPAETAGICRTMAGVWCRKLKETVNKNALCEWAKRMAGRRKARPPLRRSKRRGAR